MTRAIVPVSFLLFLLSSCAQSLDPALEPVSDYLIIGSYHGECTGTCARFVKLQNGQVYVSSDDDDSFWFKGVIEFEKSPRPESNMEHINAVVERFPSKLLSEPSRSFGEPDSYDQGGIYIEVMKDDVRKVWKVDTDPHEDIPEYLKTYLKFVTKRPL